MNYRNLLQTPALKPLLLTARFGLEKESQRVSKTGELVQTNHPEVLGNRSYHPYIQTDFAETQLELITPVANSVTEVLRYLEAIHDVAQRSMALDEMMWPLSMPPALPADDAEIVIAKLDTHEDVLYRRYLARAYGKRKQMVSGIHFNFEFDDALVQGLFTLQGEYQTLADFKNNLYMKVARNYLHSRWLITYLFGAAPVAEAGYFDQALTTPVRSIRNSRFGYTNKADIQVSYKDLTAYLADLAHLIETGKLSEEKEFYAPIRLRGGAKMADLPKTGIRYIELRNLDLNPFARSGIDKKTLEFMHLFMLFMLWQETADAPDTWVGTGDDWNELVALEHPLAQTKLKAEGQALFDQMHQFVAELDLPTTVQEAVSYFEQLLEHPEWTLAGQMTMAAEKGQTNAALGVAYGQDYYETAWERPYQLAGFSRMELSTQILLFDAIQKGLEIDVMDETDQFISLRHHEHLEYVKNANMTSKDSYIVPLIMANKTVTKEVLAKAGFRVPLGQEFATREAALAAYELFKGQGIVVKPKTTNYGIGISIFKDGASEEDYLTAIELAFAEDQSILVEEFLAGTEYRFFVLDGKVRAVLLRVPANVTGDGQRTIAELVAEKNLDPLRGSHHRAPLEQIQLGGIEKLMLKEQGLTPDSVPKVGEIVYLRENSNVSSGGDSIDVTEAMHPSYREIAQQAVTAIGAAISGIDLIIPDAQKSAQGPQDYGIIEANFNPAMHMHVYPFSGKSRRLTMDVLRLLFPEMKL